mmetsp:Transcript_4800/g.10699  ORF Transcript_4800/g.10699 Transcript_4800/m.10699 type:complete len:200 (-) Transcript_4800:267-866(-)
MSFQVHTRCIPSPNPQSFGKIIEPATVYSIVQISKTTTGTNLHLVRFFINDCKLHIINKSVLQALKLDVHVTSLRIKSDDIKSTTVNIILTGRILFHHFIQLLKCILLRRNRISRILPRRNTVIWIILYGIGGTKTIWRSPTLLQSNVFFAPHVRSLSQSKALGFGPSLLWSVVVFIGYFIGEGAGRFRRKHYGGDHCG